MSKRLTDTEKWSDPWYRKLPVAYKNFWDYLCARCDNAGVWKVDMDMAQFQVDRTIDATDALKLFEGKVAVMSPEYWHIPGFIPFQYGELSPDSKPHQAVARLVQKYQIKGYPKGIHTLKDKDKDKDSSKDVGGSGGFSFATVWARYPRKLGRKLAERHFNASVKTPQDFADIQNALDCFIREMRKEGRPDDKIPYGVTWMNNWRDWVNYGGVQMPKPPAPPPRPPEPPPRENTHEEMVEMHGLTVQLLKRCPNGPSCAMCKEIADKQNAQHVSERTA